MLLVLVGCDETGKINASEGLFTWREEDPRTRKIREGGKTFRLLYMQKFRPKCYQVETEKKDNYRP